MFLVDCSANWRWACETVPGLLVSSDFLSRGKGEAASNPHLAIEALRKIFTEESARATRDNVIPQRASSERFVVLMTKHANQQLTSAEALLPWLNSPK